MDRGKYDKISDQIMVIANRVVLKMNVALSYYNKEKRYNYHQEVEYYSQKTHENLIKINRHFDYYLSIENVLNKDDYTRIGISDMLKLRYALNKVHKYFTDPEYDDLFVRKDGELIVFKRTEPVMVTDLSMGKYLQFEPCVFTNFRGEPEIGIRMYMSSSSSYCDISVRNLDAFVYIINSINLYESAQLLINYFQKPEMGYNLYVCNTEPEQEDLANFQGKDGRTPTSTKNLSYFDKMRQMED